MRLERLKADKNLMKFFFLAVLFFAYVMILSGMGSTPSVIEEAVVNAQVIPDISNPTLLPSGMIDTLGQYKVILVGEIHFVEEHQIFMGSLLEGLHSKGVRYYLYEVGPSTGHMIDLYITGQIDELLPEQIKVDERLIQSLRSFNKGLREDGRSDEQIRYSGFDMNHWGTEYKWALAQLGELYQHHGLKDYSNRLQGSDTDSAEYLNEIEGFVGELDENGAYADLSSEVRTSLLMISETELATSQVRRQWSPHKRERFIYSQVRRIIDSSDEGESLVVNTGMWHAQLTNIWNHSDVRWLGERLKEDFKNDDKGLYSFSISAYQGILKRRFNDSNRSYFHMSNKNPRALMPPIQEFHGDVAFFLDFKGLTPSDETVNIDYPDETMRVVLDTHFNGILVYPEISVSKSSVYFE